MCILVHINRLHIHATRPNQSHVLVFGLAFANNWMPRKLNTMRSLELSVCAATELCNCEVIIVATRLFDIIYRDMRELFHERLHFTVHRISR